MEPFSQNIPIIGFVKNTKQDQYISISLNYIYSFQSGYNYVLKLKQIQGTFQNLHDYSISLASDQQINNLTSIFTSRTNLYDDFEIVIDATRTDLFLFKTNFILDRNEDMIFEITCVESINLNRLIILIIAIPIAVVLLIIVGLFICVRRKIKLNNLTDLNAPVMVHIHKDDDEDEKIDEELISGDAPPNPFTTENQEEEDMHEVLGLFLKPSEFEDETTKEEKI